jgi:hypothetical protein
LLPAGKITAAKWAAAAGSFSLNEIFVCRRNDDDNDVCDDWDDWIGFH